MKRPDLLPPGSDPIDPSGADIDPIGFSLERLQTFLIWIEQHRSAIEMTIEPHQRCAISEMDNLKDASYRAILHFQRLSELILNGYSIDKSKRMPKGLYSDPWIRMVEAIRREKGISRDIKDIDG
jgi:hypothetical protein